MSIPNGVQTQIPETGYSQLKSLVTRLGGESRSGADLTEEERRNVEAFLEYRSVQPQLRPRYRRADFKGHRAGFTNLSALGGVSEAELGHSNLLDGLDDVEDIIVKGDRLWSVFTSRAKHGGPFYRQQPTGADVTFIETCCLRYEDGKVAEGWFFADEFGICRQIGVDLKVASSGVGPTTPPTWIVSDIQTPSEIVARQLPDSDYETLPSVFLDNATKKRSSEGLTEEERTNLRRFIEFLGAEPQDRASYTAPSWKMHRRGIMHLPELRGNPSAALDQSALEGRLNVIKDIIVKGDRVWSVFAVRARQVGDLYGVPASGRMIEMLEFCVTRFERGKIVEAWMVADELGLCRQLGVPIELAAD